MSRVHATNLRSGDPQRIRRLAVVLLAFAIATTGCKEDKKSGSATGGANANAATGPANTAPLVTQAAWAPDALEELVAPIALYPDVLVGQILAASVSPQEVMDGGNWLLENQKLTGDALDKAAVDADFGPAMRALFHFPTVVDMMCQEFEWTKQLGSAFTSDQKGVLDAIQRLRKSAADAGNLQSSPQMEVEKKSEGGNDYIELKPADPKVVYVPQYDPAVVYTTPPAAAPAPATTVVVEDDDDDDAGKGLLAFGVGMAVGALIADDYCYPHYGYGAVYMGPRPFYPPAYAYRPVYPAYRPAYGYNSGGYRYNYKSGNNININVDNNYYNRFDGNQNLKRDGARSPIASDRGRNTGRDSNLGGRTGNAGRNQAATRPSTRDAQRGSGQGQQAWRGQSNYAGAKDKAGNRAGTANASRPGAGGSGTRASTRPSTVDRGYGGSGRSGSTEYAGKRAGGSGTRASSSRPSQTASAGTRQASDRAASASAGNRSTSRASTVDRPSTSASSPRRDSALSGSTQAGGGSFERAASARGNASTRASSGSSGRYASSGSSHGGGGAARSGGGGGRRR